MFALINWFAGTPSNMFDLPGTVTVLEKVLRPAIVYGFLVICFRIFGKRELAQLNPFDLVVLLSISNTVQNAIIGDDNSTTGGLIGAFTLFAVNYVVVRFVLRHRRLDQILEGTPTVLVRDGRVIRRALARELLSEAELETVAHRNGYAGLEQVQTCTLEPGGVFYLEGKRPDDQRHSELLGRLDQLSRELAELRAKMS